MIYESRSCDSQTLSLLQTDRKNIRTRRGGNWKSIWKHQEQSSLNRCSFSILWIHYITKIRNTSKYGDCTWKMRYRPRMLLFFFSNSTKPVRLSGSTARSGVKALSRHLHPSLRSVTVPSPTCVFVCHSPWEHISLRELRHCDASSLYCAVPRSSRNHKQQCRVLTVPISSKKIFRGDNHLSALWAVHHGDEASLQDWWLIIYREYLSTENKTKQNTFSRKRKQWQIIQLGTHTS